MSTQKIDNHYQIPSYITSSGDFANIDDDLLQYLDNTIQSSKAFLRSNRSFRVAEVCRRILYGDDDKVLSKDTRIEIKKLRRQGREIIGNAANIRPNFSIRTPKSDNSADDKSGTYEQLKDHWWYDRFVDRTFKEAIQEASTCIGYLFLWPRKDPNTRKWEIIPTALNYKEVFPYQIGMDGDLDKARSVTVHLEMPMAEFQEEFPAFANISPDRNAPTYMRKFEKTARAARGIRQIIKSRFEDKTESIVEPSFPVKDVFYTFTRDNSINKSGKTIRMGTLVNGELAGHNSYEVESYDGTNNINDCRLFPRRRLTIWTKDRVLFDGAAKWITNCVPVAEFRFERLPKEYLGVPVLNDGRSLELAINKMINSIKDRIEASANFPIAFDASLPDKVKKVLQRGGLKALIGKGLEMNLKTTVTPIKALFEYQLWRVDPKEFELIKSLYELQDYVQGTNDYSNMQRKNQMPAADTQEAFIQSMGVLSVDHEREISLGIMKFGRIWLQLAPQVYTLKKRLTIIGSEAMDLKDIDFDPESLVPSLDPKAEGLPYWKRLEQHLERYNLFATPGSLQERQSVTKKLTLLQVQKAGGQISSKKIYDALIGDGRYEETRTEWINEQVENAKLAAMIRKEVEAIAGAGGSPEGQPMLQQILQQLQLQNTSGQGRPSSNESSPRMEIKADKDGIQRSATATYQQ